MARAVVGLQAILTLVHIRRKYHLFPLRPYLPQLVDALEDTDSNVRECARQSIVELFTGPGVTDAARADLKKEMTKKGVRKTIADSVLARVLAGGASTPGPASEGGSSEGDHGGSAAHKEYVPPSIALMNQARRPGAGTTSRIVSSSSARELPRPVSRAAAMSPTGEGPSTPAAGGGSDVKAVYVSFPRPCLRVGMTKKLTGVPPFSAVCVCGRLRRAGTSRTSSLRC